MQVKKQQFELDIEQRTGLKLGKEWDKVVYCHPVYLTCMQSTSCKMYSWMNHKLESRLPGEIPITSDMKKEMVTHSSILVWKTPWMEEPGRLQSMGSHRVRHDWSDLAVSITANKAIGGDGIPAELFQILKDDAVKVLHSTHQQIGKTQQWPHDWKRSVFIPVPKKDNVKECQTAQFH